MPQSKVKRRRNRRDVNAQRKLFSIVLLCFSVTFYLGYKKFASNGQTSTIKLASSAIQNITSGKNKSGSASLEQEIKPLPFATVEGTDLTLYLPAYVSDVKGVGFHESEKKEAISLAPTGKYYMRESTETVSRSASLSRFPVLFVMYSRGRRQSPTSAVDIAVEKGAVIRSPINGVVTNVETYYLYGKYKDIKVEIQPEKHPELRVAMIHLDGVVAKVGQKVQHGKTEIGRARELNHCFDSQINEYLPDECDHTHVQVNKYVPPEPPQ